MHAYALNSLEDYLKEGARVLDVGCGSGYRMSFFPSLLLVSVLWKLKGNDG
jgi:protein-L-isoaspartate O-methyltransferase